MAKSGWIDITCNSQSVANNTSTIKVSGKIKTTGESYRGDSRTGTYSIYQGSTLIKSGSFTHGAPANKTTELFSITFPVNHASDGSSGVITASYNYDSGWCTGSGSLSLATIPRASSFGTISGNTIGSNITVNISRKNESFTHSLWYSFGGLTWQAIGSGIGTSKTFQIPLSVCSQIPNATSGKLTLILRTYNGSTQIGSDVSTSITVYVPSSIIPSVSMNISDPTGCLSTYGKYVQNRSHVAVDISDSGAYGSSIVARMTKVNGSNYSPYANFAISPISLNGTVTLETTVTDSRGRTATVSKSIEVLAYSLPSINTLSVARCNSDGTANSSGAYLKVVFDSTVTSLEGKNTATYTLEHKKASATDYTPVTLSDYANNYSVSGGCHVFPADTGSSYSIRLIVTDAFGASTPRTTNGSSVKKLISILKKAFGIAFGKVAEVANAIDFGLDLLIRDGVEIKAHYGTEKQYDLIKKVDALEGGSMVELTQAEYNALESAGKLNPDTLYFISDGESTPYNASMVEYDNSSSGLSANKVQGAIDEIHSKRGWTKIMSTYGSSGVDLSSYDYDELYIEVSVYTNRYSFYIPKVALFADERLYLAGYELSTSNYGVIEVSVCFTHAKVVTCVHAGSNHLDKSYIHVFYR